MGSTTTVPTMTARALIRAVALVALAVGVGVGGRRAQADAGDRCGLEWTAMRGTVSRGSRCGVFVLTGDVALTRGDSGATGRAQWDGGIEGRHRVALTVQRLTAGEGTVELEVAGAGYLLLAQGRVGLYTSEPAWAADGWRAWPAALADRRLVAPVRVEVELAGEVVIARLDGIEAGRWQVGRTVVATGSLAVWVNGPRGQRPRLRVSDWDVR